MSLNKDSWYTNEELSTLSDDQLREAEWCAYADYMYYACAEGDCYNREREARNEQSDYFSMVANALRSRGLEKLRNF